MLKMRNQLVRKRYSHGGKDFYVHYKESLLKRLTNGKEIAVVEAIPDGSSSRKSIYVNVENVNDAINCTYSVESNSDTAYSSIQEALDVTCSEIIEEELAYDGAMRFLCELPDTID